MGGSGEPAPTKPHFWRALGGRGAPKAAGAAEAFALLLDATPLDQRFPNSSHPKWGGKVKIFILKFSNDKFEEFLLKTAEMLCSQL